MIKKINNLGSRTDGQKSISSEVNTQLINQIYLDNIDFFKEFTENSKDEYAVKLYNYFKLNEKFIFTITKNMEHLILKNKKNVEKIIKYIIFRYKFYLAGTEKVNLGYPPYLLIEPVSACNLRCPFCFQTDKSFTKKPYMGVIDLDFFKKVVDEADELGVGAITIASRGEPTMHKKFSKMLEYINQKQNIFEVKSNTNATFLTEEICHSIFKNELTQIVISSDHYIKDDYERLRLGSNFEEVVRNVDMLFEIRKKYYAESNTEIRISGIDNERNLDRKKFHDFWIKRSDHVSVGFPLPRWETYKNEPTPNIKDPCEFLWDRMYVWHDGKVNPCDADYKSFLSYGNAKEFSLKELWNNKIINKNRNLHLENKRSQINPCDKCGTSFV